MDLPTPAKTRHFLGLCLAPGTGRQTRTLLHLVGVMPAWLRDQVDQHAPHLAPLRADVERAEAAAADARAAYAAALGTWINTPGEDTPTP